MGTDLYEFFLKNPLTQNNSSAIVTKPKRKWAWFSCLTRPQKRVRGQYAQREGIPPVVCCADRFASALFVFRLPFWRCVRIATVNYLINDDIRDKEVRVIGEDGAQLGIMSSEEALKIAEEKELDLVKIAPGSNPPVCKIMDYGKYRFEQSKREKEARKNQRVIEVKEIRMSPSIGENDFNTKLKNAQKFLRDGDRVKVTVRFRGREMAHTNIGEQLLRKFAEQCAELANLDKQPKLEGRNMSMFLSPKPQGNTKK